MALVQDMQAQILESVDPTPEGLRTLFNLCRSNRFTSELCRNDLFWRRLYLKVRPESGDLPPQGSWRQSYIDLINRQNRVAITLEENNNSVVKSLFHRQRGGNYVVKREFSAADTYGRLWHLLQGDIVYDVYQTMNLLNIRYNPEPSGDELEDMVWAELITLPFTATAQFNG